MSDLTEETAQKLNAELAAVRGMLGEVASRHKRMEDIVEAQIKLMGELLYIEDFLATQFAGYVSKKANVDMLIEGVGKLLDFKNRFFGRT